MMKSDIKPLELGFPKVIFEQEAKQAQSDDDRDPLDSNKN